MKSAALIVFLLSMSLVLGVARSHAETPDVPALLSRIDASRLREHVDAIDEPRNAFAQPERLAGAGAYVESQLESFGYGVTREDVVTRGVTSQNIYAEQAGTSCPERMFIVGAHYDSVQAAPGADDNASGVAAMLEIARALAGTPLPATVRFAAFTMEEDGLIGSSVMAGNLANERAEVIGMMAFDMVGYATVEGNFLVTLANTASVLQTDAVHRAAAYLPDFTVAVVNIEGNGEALPDSRRSDHAPFWDAGYQGMIVTDTANFRNPNYHQPTDTIETLDFDFMTNSTKAMLATTVDYLTYDGNDDGETDVCSGPLAATPTPTQAATTPDESPASAVPTATAPPNLPPTGFDEQVANDEGLPWWAWIGIVGGLTLVAASSAVRLRR